MSGSLTSIYDSITYALSLHGKAITQLQEQASTGNRVNRGSDSPFGRLPYPGAQLPGAVPAEL